MAGRMLMPRRTGRDSAGAVPRQTLLALFNQLFDDGTDWLSAELEVGKLEARAVFRSVLWAVSFIVCGFALLLTSVIVLGEAVATELSKHLDSQLAGSLLVGLAFFCLALAFAYAAVQKLKLGPSRSRIVRWLFPFFRSGGSSE
jgi:hypothetical protein